MIKVCIKKKHLLNDHTRIYFRLEVPTRILLSAGGGGAYHYFST